METRDAAFTRETLDIGDPGGGRVALLDVGPRNRPADALLLHANGFTARTYRGLIAPLAEDLRILATDQRGHGATTLPADPSGRRSWNDVAADLVAVLDRLDCPPLTLIGHSMGGTSALLAAARRPDRVRNLVLLDPVILRPRDALAARLPLLRRLIRRHSPLADGALRRRATFPSREAAFAAYRGRGAFRTWPDWALADYVAEGFRDSPDGTVALACAPAWEASNYLALGHDAWGALRRLRRPAAILRAASGSTCAPDGDRPPLVTVETVPGTTHFLPFEAPDRVRAAIRAAAG